MILLLSLSCRRQIMTEGQFVHAVQIMRLIRNSLSRHQRDTLNVLSMREHIERIAHLRLIAESAEHAYIPRLGLGITGYINYPLGA